MRSAPISSRMWWVMVLGLATALGLAGCAASTDSGASDGKRAVVLVSGVASVTPFTTPQAACTSGLSAGNTWTFMRDYLITEGFEVYTAPAMDHVDQTVPTALPDELRGPFEGCPEQLPRESTITSIDVPEAAGERLANFLTFLNSEYGVTSVDVVAHSLGGLFSRNGIREVQQSGSPVTIHSLTTLGSPWEAVMLAIPPFRPKKACDGLPVCMEVVRELEQIKEVRGIVEFFQPDKFGPWTEAQAGVLDGIPVTLVAGTMFTKPGGDPRKWPNDGLIQERAALGMSIPDSVLPQRSCYAFPFAHSMLVATRVGAPESQAITWNERVGSVVANGLRTAGTANQAPNRLGCPGVSPKP